MNRWLRRWFRTLGATAFAAVLTGAFWYLMGARDPRRLEVGVAAIAVLVVIVMRLPTRGPWRRLGAVAIGIAVCVGEAFVPAHRHNRLVEVFVAGLVLFWPAIRGIPDSPRARRLFGRVYLAIGGSPGGPPEPTSLRAAPSSDGD